MKKSIILEVGIVRIFVVLLQLLFLKAYSNHSTLYELGLYYFLFTLSYSLNAFVLVPLDYFQQSQIYKLKENGYSLKSFYAVNIWVLKLTGIILFLAVSIGYFINPNYSLVALIIIVLALSTYLVNFLRGLINNLERRRMAIYSLLLENGLKVGLYFICIHYFTSSSTIILISVLSASILSFCLLIFLVTGFEEFKRAKIQIFKPSDIFKFSYPISLGAVVNWIQLQGYRMILVPFGLVEIVGVYATVSNVGTNGMNAFSTIYSQLFVPNLYKSQGKYLKTYLIYALLSIVGILAISYFLSDFIVLILTKNDFVKYSTLILYGIIAEAGNFLIGALLIYLTIHNLTSASLKSTITGLIVFLITFFGLYYSGHINVFTIGIPIVVTQIVITMYLVYIIHTEKAKS
ncbi:hypothetical protein GJU39_19200 [Pedobacter petrophilus]|uniref:Oligosaccharide flippase family protein n=1 Tax=Pedobacter petrophilus TaxID=1908241 RepID=A0A7K0G3J9_9SPHI|nr:hypothetical protein [Pedobacter petrophilus]MRX78212.1 hypothetical protein [Pedobacter petrophilus]